MNKLTHVNEQGKANMVEVGQKPVQHRVAIAEGHIALMPETLSMIQENQMKKGDVLTVAEIAGIQAAKRTSELIPLCHPIMLTSVTVRCNLDETGVKVHSEARCVGQTGVEMEALTAVNVALLTIYDMCKAVDETMQMDSIRLLEKSKV
jgi:cyclic pyranopterin phosphate synthase